VFTNKKKDNKMNNKANNNDNTEHNNSVDNSAKESNTTNKSDEQLNNNKTDNKTDEQVNMARYMEKLEMAGYFPSMNERCMSMSKIGIKPDVDINTGACRGEVVQEAGMELLASIHGEIYDALPEWEKEKIKEELLSGDGEYDEYSGHRAYINNNGGISDKKGDGITPNDGRPELTVAYLRSIGYDIDIS